MLLGEKKPHLNSLRQEIPGPRKNRTASGRARVLFKPRTRNLTHTSWPTILDQEPPTKRVTGLGGIFFKSDYPDSPYRR